jgi:hypothetical protein
MRYHFIVSGPLGGGQIVANELAEALKSANGRTTVKLVPWGRYINWKPTNAYDLYNFKSKLDGVATRNPDVADIVLFGPGVMRNFLRDAGLLRTEFENSSFYHVKHTDSGVETTRAQGLINQNKIYKAMVADSDSRADQFSTRWGTYVANVNDRFSQATSSLTFNTYGTLAVSGNSISNNSGSVPEGRDVSLQIAIA